MKTKIWERTLFRVIIFILCALFASVSLCLVVFGDEQITSYQKDGKFYFDTNDVFSGKPFLESQSLLNTMHRTESELYYLFINFAGNPDPEVVKGLAFEKVYNELIHDLYERIRTETQNQEIYDPPPDFYENPNTFSLYFSDLYSWRYGWDWNGQDRYIEFDKTKMLEDPVLAPEGTIRSFEEPGVREAFETMFPGQITEIKKMIAYERQNRYQDGMRVVGDWLYYLSGEINGESRIFTNLKPDENKILDQDAIRNNSVWIVIEPGNTQSSVSGFDSFRLESEIENTTFIIAMPDDVFKEYEAVYNAILQMIYIYFVTAAVLLVCAVVFLIMLIVFTGRKRPSRGDTRRLWKLDKIFVEFQLAFFMIALITGYIAVRTMLGNISIGWLSSASGAFLILLGTVMFIVCVVVLWFLLSLVRVCKAGLFAERSLVCRFIAGPCRALANTIKSGYDGRNPLAKTLILVILFWFLTALFAGLCGISANYSSGPPLLFFILGLAVLAGAVHFTRKWAERYGQLRKGIEEIGRGNLDYKIEIVGDGKNEFDRLSAMVNELGSSQNTAFQNELKNQRLKTDLISNVSHDLKTPLTSILTYTDLLKNEGLKSKNAEEYLRIIEEKGRRLQKLTEDLFDAAKASSGAINVNKEKIELLSLINQEIAEFNGSFADAGLELIIDAAGETHYVEADGRLLWRVVDNLLRNVCKYAQPGTRVYINIKDQAEKTILEIKNTSASRLNIKPDELMERFKRGDESRATEGSGLGLAIAKDLVRLQGGWFEITIDGDLFKAIVILKPYPTE